MSYSLKIHVAGLSILHFMAGGGVELLMIKTKAGDPCCDHRPRLLYDAGQRTSDPLCQNLGDKWKPFKCRELRGGELTIDFETLASRNPLEASNGGNATVDPGEDDDLSLVYVPKAELLEITALKPFDSGDVRSFWRLPNFGTLTSRGLARDDAGDLVGWDFAGDDSQNPFTARHQLIAEFVTWTVTGVEGKVSFGGAGGGLELEPPAGESVLEVFLLNFPDATGEPPTAKLEHFACFYNLAAASGIQRIPQIDTAGQTPDSTICPIIQFP